MSENITQSNLELWDVVEAIKQITHDGLLDTIEIMNQPNFFVDRYVRGGMLRAEAEIRISGMINIAIRTGQIKDLDTPANWIAWAKRNGFATDHLKSSNQEEKTDSKSDNKKENELHSLIEDIYKSLGCPKNNGIIWKTLKSDQKDKAYDKNEIVQEITGDIIYWTSRRGIEQTMKRKTFDNFLSTLRKK
ncbi:hypothetical protein [Nitrosomonas sp.]|uniref:hypothetical protein n=1 Tax=Nitrosomonas sp. TaxID=42353 RepID=UPI0025E03667|nr:hypothetical protein [Nitrosomonas sp.]MBY0483842.1 hypothetical protein [Nitrosomonas sp.]